MSRVDNLNNGANSHCDQYLMAYHRYLELQNNDTSSRSKRSRRRQKNVTVISYDTPEARSIVFRYPMGGNAQVFLLFNFLNYSRMSLQYVEVIF